MASWRFAQVAGGCLALAGGFVLAPQLRTAIFGVDPLAQERAQRSIKQTTGADRLKTFDAIARGYDGDVGPHEIINGISFSRSKLMRRARGDVLELGVGTGRNFEYYSPSIVRRLTAVDAVPAMLDVAREKANRMASTRPTPPPLLPIALGLAADATTAAADLGTGLDLSKVEFVAGAAESLPFGDAQFDTVVDTFGLCSFEDPARVCTRLFFAHLLRVVAARLISSACTPLSPSAGLV